MPDTTTASYLCWVETTWSDTGISLADYTVTIPLAALAECWDNGMLSDVLLSELLATVLADTTTSDDHGETPAEQTLVAWLPLGVASIGTLYPVLGDAYRWWQAEITLRCDEVAAGRLVSPSLNVAV